MLRFAHWVRSLALIAQLMKRNIECRYLAGIANHRLEYLNRLVTCIGFEFYKEEHAGVSGISWHTQPLPGYSVTNSGNKTSEICWEAPICFTVYYHDKPILGMAVEFHGPVLCIRQLQGAPNTVIPEYLRQWPKMFVNAMKHFLYNTREIVSIRLYSATERHSYRYPQKIFSQEDVRKYQQNLRRRYDGTARQCGFKKNHRKYWEWDLSMPPPRNQR